MASNPTRRTAELVAQVEAVNARGLKAAGRWYNVTARQPIDLSEFQAGQVVWLQVAGERWIDEIVPATVADLDRFMRDMVDGLPLPSGLEAARDDRDDLADGYDALDDLRRAEDADREARSRPAVPVDLPRATGEADARPTPHEAPTQSEIRLGARAAALAAASSVMGPWFALKKLDVDPIIVLGIAEAFAEWLETE